MVRVQIAVSDDDEGISGDRGRDRCSSNIQDRVWDTEMVQIGADNLVKTSVVATG